MFNIKCFNRNWFTNACSQKCSKYRKCMKFHIQETKKELKRLESNKS